MPSKVPGEKIKEHIVHTEKKREQEKRKINNRHTKQEGRIIKPNQIFICIDIKYNMEQRHSVDHFAL